MFGNKWLMKMIWTKDAPPRKHRKTRIIFLFLLLSLVLPGCAGLTDSAIPAPGDAQAFETQSVATLSDLAYGNNTVSNGIYLPENGQNVPYLVLTDDYNGNCLLLRERLLDKTIQFHDPDEAFPYAAYYENSVVDQYLNTEFSDTLSDFVSSQIVDTSILITTKESLDAYSKRGVLTIQRKVFLLSYSELNLPVYYSQLNEGPPLLYFHNWPERIACHENGEPGIWWLRTPDIGDHSTVYSIASNGTAGPAGIDTIAGLTLAGLRPAFCLPGDLKVEETKQEGRTVFVLSGDNT